MNKRVVAAAQVTATAAIASADEAKRSNDADAQERTLRLRPWVGIGILKASRIIHEDGTVTVTDDGHLTIPRNPQAGTVIGYEMSVTNYGQTPAHRVGYAKEFAPTLSELDEKLENEEGPSNNILLPGESDPQAFPIPIADVTAGLGEGDLYVGMRIVYSDTDDILWTSESIMKIEGPFVRLIRRQTYKYD